jgi:hypothetical protein
MYYIKVKLTLTFEAWREEKREGEGLRETLHLRLKDRTFLRVSMFPGSAHSSFYFESG